MKDIRVVLRGVKIYELTDGNNTPSSSRAPPTTDDSTPIQQDQTRTVRVAAFKRSSTLEDDGTGCTLASYDRRCHLIVTVGGAGFEVAAASKESWIKRASMQRLTAAIRPCSRSMSATSTTFTGMRGV